MKSELLHGTLEILILKTLSWGPMHGFGIDPLPAVPSE